MSCKDESAPTKPPEGLVPDSTSHEFAWQIDILGDGNSSRLNDVCIIDENDVWAVGRIYLKDANGEFTEPMYNAVHWDGNEWQLVRIPVKIWNTNSFLIGPLQAMYAFSSNDIFVTTGGEIIRYDGQQWGKWEFLFNDLQDTTFGGVNKFWGTSSSDLWGVGNKGNIFHYNGSTWQKLESGTNLDIQDIWGIVDAKTQEKMILCAASDKYHSSEMKIIRILPQNVVGEFDWTPQRKVHSVWFDVPTRIYACGSGFFIYENGQWQQDETLPTIFKNRVRANHRNDLFVAGDFGLLTHYNGKSWRVYDSLRLSQGNYEGLAVKDDLVVAVGWNGDRAVVLRGVRTN